MKSIGYAYSIQPVIEGSVALFPRTFKCLLDLSSPPSITSHKTESSVLDFTINDIIPPIIDLNSQCLCKAQDNEKKKKHMQSNIHKKIINIIHNC